MLVAHNTLFERARKRVPQKCPPIWFMRQAGRYHAHYQNLRKKYSFMELCKVPELAAEVTWGPIQDFDFDVAILFSDLLFPLEALGMGLSYPEGGPQLGWHLTPERMKDLKPLAEALPTLQFQKTALEHCREKLPQDKSLIGFVGGPWTLFTYAVQGAHDGSLINAKRQLPIFEAFCAQLVPLLIENVRLQLAGGAEIVMIFDTAAGELSPHIFRTQVIAQIEKLARAFPGRLGYYSKGTHAEHLDHPLFSSDAFVGLGVDHRWNIFQVLNNKRFGHGFVQGNFDQALLHADTPDFLRHLDAYLRPLKDLDETARAGWVCGLGHGVLPKTPEMHVRKFIEIVRKQFA